MLNFPDSPTINQKFTAAGATWMFDGTKWEAGGAGGLSIPVTIPQGGTNATTAPQALVNLGAVAKAGDTMTGALNITPTGTALNVPNGNVVVGGALNTGGNVVIGGVLNVNGGGIGAQGGIASFTGRVMGINGGYPSVSAYDNAHGWCTGLWTDGSGNLGLGACDAAGNPATQWATVTGAGRVQASSFYGTSTGNNLGDLTVGNVQVNGNLACAASGSVAGNWTVSTGLQVYGGTFFNGYNDGWCYFNGSLRVYDFNSQNNVSANGSLYAGGIQIYNNGGWLYSVNAFQSAGDVYANGVVTATNYVSCQNGIFYGGQGAGALYQLRWDGSGFYAWVNTYGYIWLTNPSSRAIKRDVSRVEYDALAVLRGVPLHRYTAPGGPLDDDGNWIKSAQYECGWIAEELETAIPNSVLRLKHQFDETQPDALLPQWQPILTYALRAIQQLADKLDALEARS